MLDNFGKLFTNVVIRVWFPCLLKESANTDLSSTDFSVLPLATLVYYVITKRLRQCRQNQNVVAEKTTR